MTTQGRGVQFLQLTELYVVVSAAVSYSSAGVLALMMPHNALPMSDQMYLQQSCLYNISSVEQCIAVCADCLCGK